MAFPSFRDMIEPLLRVLVSAPEGMTARSAQDSVADYLGLSADDRERRVPGGTQVLFRHRTNWAHDRLKRAYLSSAPRRGVWRLTPTGIALISAQAAPIPATELHELARAGRSVRIATLSPELPRKGPLRAKNGDDARNTEHELTA